MADLGFAHRYVPPRGPSGRTILVLHGTGGDENSLLPLAAQVDAQAGLLSPRGKVLEDGMPRFFRRFAEGVFDLEDLRFRTLELAEFISAAAGAYKFDAGRVVAFGYSNGANIAASLLLLSPKTLAGGALLHAMVPLVPENPPALAGKRVFLSAGVNDPIVPADQARALAEMLTGYGAEVQTAWYNAGHSLTREELTATTNWFRSLDGNVTAG